MEPHRGMPPGKLGPVAIAGIALLAVSILIAVLLGNAHWRAGRSSVASGSQAGGARTAETARQESPSPSPLEPQGGVTVRGARERASGPARSAGEGEAASRLRYGDRAGGTDSRLPGRGASLPRQPLPGPDDTQGATEGAGTSARSRRAAPGPLVAKRSSEGFPQIPPESRPDAPSAPLPVEQSAPSAVAQPDPSESHQEGSPPRDGTPLGNEAHGSDRSPPVLESLSFDPPEVTDGSVTMLSVQVSDDLSGVKTVSGTVRSPSGVAIQPFTAVGDSGGSLFTTRITIPSKAESGNWYVMNLRVLDRADNALAEDFSAATVPTGGALRVSSADSDSTAPDVRDVLIEKGLLRGGEKNLIKIEVEDDRSGVATVVGAFQSPSGSALVQFICRLNVESDLWEGEVSIPINADCGEWTVHHLRVADSAGNKALLMSDARQVARVAFKVWDQIDCDSSPPTLESISLSPTIVSSETGAEVVATAGVHDEGSGVTSMFGWVSGPASTNGQVPRILFSCTADPSNPESSWTGKIVVPQHAAKGTWKIGLVRVRDRALNTRDYTSSDPVLAESTLEVQ